MLAPTCDFQEPGDDNDPIGPPQEPPGTTRFPRPERDGEGVCERLAPTLSVAVEEAVMVLLGVLVGELDGSKKDTEATYPNPVTLESEENTAVRRLDDDVTESPAEVRSPSSTLPLLDPSYTLAGSQQDSASAKVSVNVITLPEGASKIDGRHDQLLP